MYYTASVARIAVYYQERRATRSACSYPDTALYYMDGTFHLTLYAATAIAIVLPSLPSHLLQSKLRLQHDVRHSYNIPKAHWNMCNMNTPSEFLTVVSRRFLVLESTLVVWVLIHQLA